MSNRSAVPVSLEVTIAGMAIWRLASVWPVTMHHRQCYHRWLETQWVPEVAGMHGRYPSLRNRRRHVECDVVPTALAAGCIVCHVTSCDPPKSFSLHPSVPRHFTPRQTSTSRVAKPWSIEVACIRRPDAELGVERRGYLGFVCCAVLQKEELEATFHTQHRRASAAADDLLSGYHNANTYGSLSRGLRLHRMHETIKCRLGVGAHRIGRACTPVDAIM
jgi:hypothetical protein